MRLGRVRGPPEALRRGEQALASPQTRRHCPLRRGEGARRWPAGGGAAALLRQRHQAGGHSVPSRPAPVAGPTGLPESAPPAARTPPPLAGRLHGEPRSVDPPREDHSTPSPAAPPPAPTFHRVDAGGPVERRQPPGRPAASLRRAVPRLPGRPPPLQASATRPSEHPAPAHEGRESKLPRPLPARPAGRHQAGHSPAEPPPAGRRRPHREVHRAWPAQGTSRPAPADHRSASSPPPIATPTGRPEGHPAPAASGLPARVALRCGLLGPRPRIQMFHASCDHATICEWTG